MFLFKKTDSARRKTIERLYGAIVAQARSPEFYRDFGVPDTVEGRFDLVVLHLHLVNERLAGVGEAGKMFGQELLDYFFEDMDASLREIGIGDLSVPKKMRTLAEAYLGRSAAYATAIAAEDKAVLSRALARNILGSEDSAAAGALASYAIAASKSLKAQAPEAFFAANIEFPKPAKVAGHV